jgi:hypothetical protein
MKRTFSTFDSFGPLKILLSFAINTQDCIVDVRLSRTGRVPTPIVPKNAPRHVHFPGARRPAQVKPAEPSGTPTWDSNLLLYRVSLSNEHFFLVVPVPENKLSSECFLERPKSESFAFGEIREST